MVGCKGFQVSIKKRKGFFKGWGITKYGVFPLQLLVIFAGTPTMVGNMGYFSDFNISDVASSRYIFKSQSPFYRLILALILRREARHFSHHDTHSFREETGTATRHGLTITCTLAHWHASQHSVACEDQQDQRRVVRKHTGCSILHKHIPVMQALFKTIKRGVPFSLSDHFTVNGDPRKQKTPKIKN